MRQAGCSGLPDQALLFADLFQEITAILLLAAALGVFGLLLRWPLIVSLPSAGILAGPSGIGLLRSRDRMALLAHLGIALLLCAPPPTPYPPGLPGGDIAPCQSGNLG